MPYCTVCSVPFTGRGSYCTQHNSHLQSYFNALPQHDIKYRTNMLAKHNHNYRRPHKPLAIGFRNSHEGLTHYHPRTSSNALALAGYDAPSHHHEDFGFDSFNYGRSSDPLLSASNLRPLGHAFERLSEMHAITQLAYTIDTHGTRSVIATANPDREQCSSCGVWFPDRMRLMGHLAERPVGCDVHGVCLRWDDVLIHADEERHERCFVRGCTSVYRQEGGWKGSVVEGHVRLMHGYRSARVGGG